ncbi:MAG: hypothetical protein Q4B58_00150 [Bacteroidales bacterium]|nr:hypothetical protein [Bacteroidales bacterium]
MKHCILFLNYSHSRLENPVFRQFMQVVPGARRASLIFSAKTPEARELIHDVNELRRKETNLSDVTFHLCIDLEKSEEALALEQTVRLIHRTFPAADNLKYPVVVYARFASPELLNDKQLRIVWDNLAYINNLVASYSDFRFVNQIYLYHDLSMQSLAVYLHDTIQANIAPVALPQTESVQQEEWPAIFGTFNAAGITYPEQEVRRFLQLKYVEQLMQYSKPERNPVPMQMCIDLAQRILANVPIEPKRITLQEEMFINIDDHNETKWKTIDNFWIETTELQSQALGDIPREEWLTKIRQRMDVQYQSRFRSMGVDYFFQMQGKKTDIYSSVMLSIIHQVLYKELLAKPFTPEAQKNILRAIVNILQQRAIEIQNMQADTEQQLKMCELDVLDITNKWNALNIFSRLVGKDTKVLNAYTEALQKLYTLKSIIPGYGFALKLLNELIPAVQAMIERFDESQKLCTQAHSVISQLVNEANPKEIMGSFSQQQLDQACVQLEADSEYFLNQYIKVVSILLGKPAPIDGDDLIARIEGQLGNEIDAYLDQATSSGKIAPVINQSITERMEKIYADKGGIKAFISVLEQHTQLNLRLREERTDDQYLLISPALSETIDKEIVHSDDQSHILLLHLLHEVRLIDLDGFSGQKIFIEPSLF